MRRILYAVLTAGLFLLLLSALVITPEEGSAPEAAADAAGFQAVFQPLIPAVVPETADSSPVPVCARFLLFMLPALLFFVLPKAGLRDANGRVLCAVRYENSVYQLFRPETAGG